mmetsp:Transcript_22299/g.69840  ORF Transcript_22299/g.69840 Transcript_22299/m.69840 type:complete len:466 (+) Transcript_22299:451-1848(+)
MHVEDEEVELVRVEEVDGGTSRGSLGDVGEAELAELSGGDDPVEFDVVDDEENGVGELVSSSSSSSRRAAAAVVEGSRRDADPEVGGVGDRGEGAAELSAERGAGGEAVVDLLRRRAEQGEVCRVVSEIRDAPPSPGGEARRVVARADDEEEEVVGVVPGEAEGGLGGEGARDATNDGDEDGADVERAREGYGVSVGADDVEGLAPRDEAAASEADDVANEVAEVRGLERLGREFADAHLREPDVIADGHRQLGEARPADGPHVLLLPLGVSGLEEFEGPGQSAERCLGLVRDAHEVERRLSVQRGDVHVQARHDEGLAVDVPELALAAAEHDRLLALRLVADDAEVRLGATALGVPFEGPPRAVRVVDPQPRHPGGGDVVRELLDVQAVPEPRVHVLHVVLRKPEPRPVHRLPLDVPIVRQTRRFHLEHLPAQPTQQERRPPPPDHHQQQPRPHERVLLLLLLR